MRHKREGPENEKVPQASPMSLPKKAGERMVLKIKAVEYPFRWCPPGTFLMGSPDDEADRYDNETQHKVTLTHGFWLLETEVTQEMWEIAMGSNPSHFKGAKRPVETVSWEDCIGFATKLNSLSVAPAGFRFSLPTEAQWEYACRAGTTTPFHFGSELNGVKANCNGNNPYGTTTKGPYLEGTREAGRYASNAWGLYDMHGNVLEWCSDWYADYPSGAVADPTRLSGNSYRVYRGGSWCDSAYYCRSACRRNIVTLDPDSDKGLRLSLVRENE